MKNLYTLIILLLAFTATIKAQVSEQEFQALKALYNATDGDHWTKRTGWENINTTATKDDVTKAWWGLLRFSEGHLTEINLNYNNLIGNIPPQIGDLSWLKWLGIGGNKLSGVIPEEIGQLLQLEELEISANSIVGPFPTTMENLVNLRTLRLTQNPLNIEFPATLISHWPNFERLDGSSCGFTGTLPDFFESIPYLNNFDIGLNKISGEIPPSLSNLKNLYEIVMGSNQFTGDLPSLDSSKNTLNSIFLDGNQFTGEIPVTYGEMPVLKRVMISFNKLHGNIPSGIFRTGFTSFDLQQNYFTFAALEPVINQLIALSNKSYYTGYIFPLNQNSLSINKGEALVLNATTLSIHPLGGNNNRYKWFRNDVEIYSGNSPIYTVLSAGVANAGIYRFEVTNTVVTGVTLKSDNITVSIIGSNQAPTDISLSQSSIDENFSGVAGTLSATDPDEGDTPTFSFASGNGTNDRDNNQFSITGNQFSINNGPNFETTPNLNVLISANDGNGGIFTKAFVITVNNVNEAPVFKGQVTSNTIDENTANGSVVLTLTGEDPEGSPVTFSITGGNENGAFGINSNKLVVSDNTKLNYDVKNSYSLTVNISDGALSSSITLNVSLNKMNSLPVVQNATFNINENSPAGTVLGLVTATDSEGDPLTYSILSGNELSAFTLVGNTLSVANNEPLDFETNPAFTIIINVSDGISTVPATVTINLNNVQELTDNDILTISVPGIVGEAEIDALAHTVRVYVSNVDRRSLAATYTLSPQANANPASGATFDFSAAQSITVTSQSGNTQVWTVTVTYQTGENEINGLYIKVYPNPSTGFLHVAGLNAGSQIKIVSSAGQTVLRKDVTNTIEQFDISDLNPGNYLIIINSTQKTTIQKISKM